jgi:hypothetical protein
MRFNAPACRAAQRRKQGFRLTGNGLIFDNPLILKVVV